MEKEEEEPLARGDVMRRVVVVGGSTSHRQPQQQQQRLIARLPCVAHARLWGSERDSRRCCCCCCCATRGRLIHRKNAALHCGGNRAKRFFVCLLVRDRRRRQRVEADTRLSHGGGAATTDGLVVGTARGTMAVVMKPSTLGELQLFRVLQRANLLSYYEPFVAQGGDDVAQLCEASEEEFLEIMALVGMASKPLHVRRLQKALQEWVSNPGGFSQPLTKLPAASIPLTRVPELSASAVARPNPASNALEAQVRLAQSLVCCASKIGRPGGMDAVPATAGSHVAPHGPSLAHASAQARIHPAPTHGQQHQVARAVPLPSAPAVERPSPPLATARERDALPPASLVVHSQQRLSPADSGCRSADEGPGSPPSSPPRDLEPGACLDDASIQSIGESAQRLLSSVSTPAPPQPSPEELRELLRGNRKQGRSLAHILDLHESDRRRMDEIRRYSAIYGRYDSKRKDGRQLTLHEMTVNEAAAQLCARDLTLLIRRDELFPLARQVVRESGYHYSRKYSKSKYMESAFSLVAKRPRLEGGGLFSRDDTPNPRTVQAELAKLKRQDRLFEIEDRLRTLRQGQDTLQDQLVEAKSTGATASMTQLQVRLELIQAEQHALSQEQAELLRRQRRSDRYFYSKQQRGEQGTPEDGADDSDSSGDDAADAWEDGASDSSMAGAPGSGELPGNYRPSPLVRQQLVQRMLMDEGLRLARQHAILAPAEVPHVKAEPAWSEDGANEDKTSTTESVNQEERVDDCSPSNDRGNGQVEPKLES
ncbi:NGFI-A-binding protein 1 isoform X2 [Lampetra fluviatilis]